MDVSRRQFFKICAGGMAGTTAAMLGFAPKMALAQARNYKLLRAKEIRNTCTYCSVGCGLLMYSLGAGRRILFYSRTLCRACRRAAEFPPLFLVLARRADGLRRVIALLVRH